ncbi:MAG: hypothetical protein ACLQVA_14720 [Candidatus Brocadiia bacterium]
MPRAHQKRLRAVQDIRTLSGARNHLSQPHRGYMRIACLELERFRRNKERDCATARVRQLDARFREIEAEQTAILDMLGPEKAGQGPRRTSFAPVETQKAGFRIKY